MSEENKNAPSTEGASIKINELETRSPLYLRRMSDDVKARLSERAKKFNVAEWVVAEVLLKDALGITKTGIDLNEFLGLDKNRARIGNTQAKSRIKR